MEPHEPTAEDDSTGATAHTTAGANSSPASHPDGLAEVAQVALKLGLTAFGGPAAHIAMLREETVVRRQWLTDAYFLDLVGATNLIPGPNSTEMVIHVGYLRAGWRGLLVAGTLFILPAATIVLALGLGVRPVRDDTGRGITALRNQAGRHRRRRSGPLGTRAHRAQGPLAARDRRGGGRTLSSRIQ